MLAATILLILVQLAVCRTAINGFYYSPTPIGVDGGSMKINSYDPYFTQIHSRDMGILQGMVNYIRISSLGDSTRNHNFLNIVQQHNISVIASFGLQPYILNSPSQLQLQLNSLRSDFTKFIQTHKTHPAIKMWCIGDVEDYLFNVGTSLQQYENLREIVTGLIGIIQAVDTNSTRQIAFAIRTRSFDPKQIPHFDLLGFNVWLFSTEGETGEEIIDHVDGYAGTKSILIQLEKNAWDYADGVESQAAQLDYLNETVPAIQNLPNVIGNIFMEFSDQWWRGLSIENTDCIGINNYIHSPCGAIAQDFNISDYSFYFNSARWSGATEQFNLWGRHCIKPRGAFAFYLQLTGKDVGTFASEYCVFVYEWYKMPVLILVGISVIVIIICCIGSAFVGVWHKRQEEKDRQRLLLNADPDLEASLDSDSSGRFYAPSTPPPPIPPRQTHGHVKLNFDEDISKWVIVNSDSPYYQFCFGISMKCVGTDENLENIASFFLRQHVEKHKEAIWNMLDHEQAAIVSQYKPKPPKERNRNNNHNKPSASRRHSSIAQSVHLTVQDIRRYSTLEPKGERRGNLNITVPHLYSENSVGVHHEGYNHFNNDDEESNEPEAVSFIAAMENIHFRTLEGYFCWLQATKKDYANDDKSFQDLYAETLLFRVMASIAEHVLHCPERLAFLYHQVLTNRKFEQGKTIYELNLDEIQAGLSAMHSDSPDGVNFDDINDCGMLEKQVIEKTWKESSGLWVLLDILRNYGSILFVKIWILALAWWWDACYQEDTIKCSMNFGSSFALVDAALFGVTELILCFYVLWQNKWDFRHQWMRIVRALVGVASAAVMVYGRRTTFGGYMAVGYLLVLRFVVCFVIYLIPRYKVPLYISGKVKLQDDDKANQKEEKKKRFKISFKMVKPWMFWILTLGSTLVLERLLVVPIFSNIDFASLCYLQCPPSGATFAVSCVCFACQGTVLAIFFLMLVTCMMDTFLIFSVMISIFGYFEGRYRKVENVRETTQILIYIAPDSPLGLELKSAFGKNWRQCCQIWNSVIEELWECDLICAEDKEKLLVNEYKNNQGSEKVVELRPANNPDASGPSSAQPQPKKTTLRHKMPIDVSGLNSTARYRISFFIRTLPTLNAQNRYCHASGKKTLPRVSQIITCYEETVLLAEHDLKSKSGTLSNLEHLVTNFPDEWANFEQRMKYKHGCLLYDFLDEETAGPGAHSERFKPNASFLSMQIRLWASYRSQTVARTIRGAISYHKAVRCMLQNQNVDWTRYVELVIAHQLYGKPEGNHETAFESWKQKYEDINLLMELYKEYPILLVYDYDKKASPPEVVLKVLSSAPHYINSFTYATIIEKYDTTANELTIVSVLPRIYPLRLGKASKTQGKSGNQTTLGLKAISGHIIQMMDANMDGSISEGFKIPYVTSTFYLANNSRTQLRYRIIGFRESIFTGSAGAVGKCMANSEFSFGTIFQRVLASSLNVRMHYGHPDFIDAFWAINRGGLSKASKQINLSEDIFAGFQAFARGEEIWHADHLEWQKGRETSFMTAAGFLWKISSGGAAMMRSRDLRLINDGLDIMRKLSLFYGSAGFFFNNAITNVSIFAYVLCFFFLSLGGVTVNDVGLLKSPLGDEWLFSLGMVTMLPLLSELWLEHGFFQGSIKFLSSVIQSAIMFTFHNKVVGETFSTCLITGKAQYVSTGRPNSYTYYTKKAAYHAYVNSHYNSAMQVFAMYIIYRIFIDASGGILPMIVIILAAIIWLIAPVIFCPHPIAIGQDYKIFLYFIMGSKQGMHGDQYESLYGYWSAQEREEFDNGLLSSQLFGWGSYLVRLAVLVLISPSNLWDAMLPYAMTLIANACTTIMWKQMGKNNVATLVWMFSPLVVLAFCQPINSFFSREVFYSGIFFMHVMGCLKYPMNILAVPIVRRVCALRAARESGAEDTSKEKDARVREAQEKRMKEGVQKWLDDILALSLFYHLHLYVAIIVMAVQFVVQAVLALMEVLCGLHSAVLLNSRMVGGVLLQQCAPMRKTYHGVFLRLSTYHVKARAIYSTAKK